MEDQQQLKGGYKNEYLNYSANSCLFWSLNGIFLAPLLPLQSSIYQSLADGGTPIIYLL